jgi:hypothetical protein
LRGSAADGYTVAFVDNSRRYEPQWWNGQPSQDLADPLSVSSRATASGIDAALQPII